MLQPCDKQTQMDSEEGLSGSGMGGGGAGGMELCHTPLLGLVFAAF